MANNIKSFLMQKNPILYMRLFSKELLETIKSYYNLPDSDIDIDAPISNITDYRRSNPLFEVLLKNKDIKVFEALYELSKITFIDRDTPPELFSNPVFVDFYVHKDPSCIIYLPNDLITSEYVKLFEDFIPKYRSSITPFLIIEDSDIIEKKNLLKSDIILNYLTSKLPSEVASVSDIDKIVYLIENLPDNPERVRQIIKSIKFSDNFSVPYPLYRYDVLPPLLQENDDFLEICILHISRFWESLPANKIALLKKILFNQNGLFGSLLLDDIDFNEANPIINEIQKDKDIFVPLMMSITKRCYSHNDDISDIDVINMSRNFDVSLIPFRFKIIDFKFDLSSLSPEVKYLLFNYNGYKNDILLNDLELFKYIIKIKDSKLFYLFVDKFIDNNEAINHILRIALEDGDFYEKCYGTLTYIIPKMELGSDERIILLLDLLDKYEGLNETIIHKISFSSAALSLVIDYGYFALVEKFNSSAFNGENIIKLLDYYSIEKMRHFVNNDSLLEDIISLMSKEQFEKVFSKSLKVNSRFTMVLCIKYIIINNYNSPIITEYKQECMEKLTNYAENKNATDVLRSIIKGDLKAVNIEFIGYDKCRYYMLNFGNVEDIANVQYLSNLPFAVLEKINKKQIKHIIQLLKAHNVSIKNIPNLAINIFLSVGYQRARDLLGIVEGKNYGPVTEEKLMTIFGQIDPYQVEFKKEGNGYTPVLNNEWINLLFGDSYKVLNTPIRNYLNNNQDAIDDFNKRMEKINNDASLSLEKKQVLQDELKLALNNYTKDVDSFIKNASRAFNCWDSIKEQFMKKKNTSKLNIKLNISEVNSIINIFDSQAKNPELEPIDYPLLSTDVFQYAGYDLQYTSHPEKVPSRCIELSRMMDKIHTKKFPDVRNTIGEYTIELYNPQDRNIIAAGYKSGCCFRPNGNADNGGKNNSLLTYCVKEEYGGGVRIYDKSGKIIMFSPVLRNGNVLMIHSIETVGMNKEEIKIVHELLKEYATETIRVAEENDDDISFVLITNLHHLDVSYTSGIVPTEKKFTIYDSTDNYKGMYNNLDVTQMILAKKDGKSIDDIDYSYVPVSYDYPVMTSINTISIDNQDIELISTLESLSEEIKKLTLLKVKCENIEEKYEITKKINALKQEYNLKYKELLSKVKGQDIYSDYKNASKIISYIAQKNDTKYSLDIKDCIFSTTWYISITSSGELYADSLETDNQIYIQQLQYYKELYPNSTWHISESNSIPEDIQQVIR